MEQNIKNTFANFSIQMGKDVEYDNYSDQEIISKWTANLLSLNNEFRKETQTLSFKELYSETLLAISLKTEGNTLFDSVKTGFPSLDRVMGDLPMGELVIVGARPAMGKTAFLISVIANSIKDKNEPIAYFSLGNSAQSIILKLMAQLSEISYDKILRNSLVDYEIDQIADKTKVLSLANLTIKDTCFTIESIVAETYFLVTEKGAKLIIIDYLQLVQAKGKMNRELEVSKVCRELKALARKYNICVLVTSQLSRAVETRGGDKRPQLSDLRESGAIEQDADKVVFIHRPEYYNITEDCEGHDTRGVAEFIVAKNRQGFINSTTLKFIGQFSKFVEREISESFDYSNNINPFVNIRKDEFNTSETIIRGTKMNDIEEDHPF